MKIKAFYLAAILMLSVSGCATIVSGKTQKVTFTSEPTGAAVLLNGTQIGVTPLSLELQRKKDQTVTFKLDGYKDQSLPLATKMNGAVAGNILLGGLFGTTTDASTGAMYKYEPGQFAVKLEKM